MRQDIKLSTVDAAVSDRSSGRRANTTIAFRISYDAPDPQRAQKVVTDLVSLYLEENVKARQQSVAQTTAFLTEEADRLAKQLQDTEAKLAVFKRRYAGRLPDSAAVNMQLADRMQSELLRVEREISMLQDRKVYLEAQLPLLRPNAPPPTSPGGESVLAPEERLRSLQAQYASSAARYGADHPDIRRLQREIAALKGEVGGSSRDGDLYREAEARGRTCRAQGAILGRSPRRATGQALDCSAQKLEGERRGHARTDRKAARHRRESAARQSRVYRGRLATREREAGARASLRVEGGSSRKATRLRLAAAPDS